MSKKNIEEKKPDQELKVDEKRIILTKQEAQAVLQMIHLALQNKGGEVLENSYILARRIQSQL